MVRIAALLFALLVAVQPMAASAQGRSGRDMPFDGPGGGRGPDRGGNSGNGGGGGRGGQTISMAQAVAIVKSHTPGGRLLDASPAGANYRIVMITPQGRRIDFIVDASSGAILSGG